MLRKSFLAALVIGSAFVGTPAFADTPDNFVGAGIRTGLGETTDLAIISKIKLVELGGNTSLSVRPTGIVADEFEAQLPVTVDLQVNKTLRPYVGAGIAVNNGGEGLTDPMVVGGLDVAIAKNTVLNLNSGLILEDGETDAQVTIGVGFGF
jgi:hypothetical protein